MTYNIKKRNFTKKVPERNARSKHMKVGEPSDVLKGKRREYAIKKAHQHYNELIKHTPRDREFGKFIPSAISLGPVALARHMSCMPLSPYESMTDVMPYGSLMEKDHHNSYKLRFRLYASINKILEYSLESKAVSLVEDIFKDLPFSTQCDLRERISEMTPVTEEDMDVLVRLNKVLNGGPLKHQRVKKIKDLHPIDPNVDQLVSLVGDYLKSGESPLFLKPVLDAFDAQSSAGKARLLKALSNMIPADVLDYPALDRLCIALGAGPIKYNVPKAQVFESFVPDLGVKSSVEALTGSINGAANTLSDAIKDFGQNVSNANINHNVGLNLGITDTLSKVLNMLMTVFASGSGGFAIIDAFWGTLDSVKAIPDAVRRAIEATFNWAAGLVAPVLGPQSGLESKTDRATLATILLKWLPYFMGKEYAELFMKSHFVKAVEVVSGMTKDYIYGVRSITGFITMLKRALNHLASLMGLNDFAMLFSNHPIIFEARQLLEDMNTRMETKEFVPQHEDAKKVSEMIKALDREFGDAIKLKDPDAIVMKDIRDRLMKVNAFTSCGFANSKMRDPPVVVVLAGRPGIGKSHVANLLATAFVISEASNEKLNRLDALPDGTITSTYHQNGLSEYSDGLEGDAVVIVNDEFLAVKDTGMGTSATLAEFTSAVSDAPHHPNMAQVDKKGNTPYSPAFMLNCTNVMRIGADTVKSLTDPQALIRRLHFCYDVDLPDEYQNDLGRIDVDKVLEEANDDPYYCQNLFYRYDMRKGERLSEAPLTLKQVKEECVARRAWNQEKFKLRLDAASRLKNALIAERRAILNPVAQAGEGWTEEEEKTLTKVKLNDLTPNDDKELSYGGVTFDKNLYSYCSLQERTYNNILLKKTQVLVKNGKETVLDALKTVTNICNVVVRNYPYTTLLTGIVAALGVIAAVTSKFDKVVTQSISSATKTRARRSARGRRGVTGDILYKGLDTTAAPVTQANVNVEVLNVIQKVCLNVFEVYMAPLVEGTRSLRPSVRIGYAVCLYQNTYVVPRHYHNTFENGYTKYLGGVGGRPYVEFKQVGSSSSGFIMPAEHLCANFIFDADKEAVDRAYVVIPPSLEGRQTVKPRKNITKIMAIGVRDGAGWFVQPSHTGLHEIKDLKLDPCMREYMGSDGTEFHLSNGMRYNMVTLYGQCGSPIFGLDSEGKPAFIGIHTAGYGKGVIGGYACGFDDGMDALMMSKSSDAIDRATGLPQSLNIEAASGIVGGMTIIGKISKPPIQRSRIVTRLADYVEISGKTPVSQTKTFVNGVIVDPVEKSNAKYSKTNIIVDRAVIHAAKVIVAGSIAMNTKVKKPTSLMTIEQAFESLDNLPMVNRKSSPGLRVSKEIGVTDKKSFMGHEGRVDFEAEDFPRVKKMIQADMDKIYAGEPVTTIYKDFVKDEVLPIDKVAVGKARKVSGSCIVGTIVTRIAYGHFCDEYTDPGNMGHNGSSIGINPYSHKWAELAESLGSYIFSTDYSGFDAGLGTQLLDAAFDVIESLSPTTNPKILKLRAWVRLDTTNSVHAFDGNVLEWSGSNPSGNVLTTIINNICQTIICQLTMSKYMLTSCRDLLCLPEVLPKEHFMDVDEVYDDQFETTDLDVARKIRTFYTTRTYGDDGLTGVDARIANRITTKDLAIAAGSYGWLITNGDKTDPYIHPQKPTSIYNVSYLKRGFKWVGGHLCCPLEMESIYQSLAFAKANAGLEQHQQVVSNACREWSMHGEDVYLRETIRLRDVLSNEGMQAVLPFDFAEAFDKTINGEADIWVG
jgi:hypothetical protein